MADMLMNMLDLDLSQLRLTAAEKSWLASNCPYFSEDYLDYLANFQFDPIHQVKLVFVPLASSNGAVTESDDNNTWGTLDLEIRGDWQSCILYEVPVMAIISESYFLDVDVNWDYVGQSALAEEKGDTLFDAGCMVSEFGTRRRRSYLAQTIALQGLIQSSAREVGSTTKSTQKTSRGRLAGTSNVHLAMKFNITPIGTIAHEFIMATAVLFGYQNSNSKAMDLWDAAYPCGTLSIMLTDTFTTKPFFEDFIANPERARRWKGLRHDSGSAIDFIQMARSAFLSVGADPATKLLVFSDGLNVERCLDLKKRTDAAGGMLSSFGIGTAITNDFQRVESPVVQEIAGAGPIRTNPQPSKALNMVIKLSSINGEFAIKLSDDITKNTGDLATIRLAKESLHLLPSAAVA